MSRRWSGCLRTWGRKALIAGMDAQNAAEDVDFCTQMGGSAWQTGNGGTRARKTIARMPCGAGTLYKSIGARGGTSSTVLADSRSLDPLHGRRWEVGSVTRLGVVKMRRWDDDCRTLLPLTW